MQKVLLTPNPNEILALSYVDTKLKCLFQINFMNAKAEGGIGKWTSEEKHSFTLKPENPI